MRRTNQGGSLAGFIIIGVLLTLVLVGGLYGLNRYNAQRAADETAATEEQAEESPSSDASKTEVVTDQPSVQSRTEQASPDTTQQTQTQSATQPSPAAQPSTPAARSGQLPQTGPADALLGVVAVTMLTFAGVHYVRSRSLAA